MTKYYVICLLLILSISMWAVEANEFLLGSYSQYQIRYAGDDYVANFGSLRDYLYNAGYNATTYGNAHSYRVSDECDFSDRIPYIFDTLENSGINSIKSVLDDNAWYPLSGRVGVKPLAYGNRLQIEAEYELIDSVGIFVVDNLNTDNESDCKESYDYVTKHDIGTWVPELGDNLYSNDHAWVCNSSQGDVAGIALSSPRKRWKPHYESWPRMLSSDIAFFNGAINDNKLYLTVAMRYEDITVGEPVATISLKLYNPPIPADYDEYGLTYPADYVNIALTPVDPLYGTSIAAVTEGLYPSTMLDPYQNYLFQYYVDLSTLKPYMNGDEGTATREFYHINPEIYWHGNGKLTIDYITIEDEFSRSVGQGASSPYLAYLDSQINDLASSNLLYHYSLCEPRAGQLQMYENIQNHLNTLTPPQKMVTAMWLKDYLLEIDEDTPYNYHKRFLHESSPDRIMVDVYPLQGNLTWTGSNPSAQTKIDEMVHYYYHKLVTNVQSLNPDTEILHVPQTFGVVLSGSGSWSYNMPPRSMIKALKFLPLCYASDGTMDFCVASNPNDYVEGGSWVTPLVHSGSLDNKYNNLQVPINNSAYDYITVANAKIAVYGPTIRQLEWINANKIMDSGIVPYDPLDGEDNILLDEVCLDNINVTPDSDTHTGYSGYVQCGYYKKDDSLNANPYFMLVNRRSVYPTGVTAPLRKIDLHFTDAPPQVVNFQLSNASHNIFGTHVGLYDQYDNTIWASGPVMGTINVPVGPGDGRLLQMCSTLPLMVNANADVKEVAYLSGSITIDQGAVVTIHAGTVTSIFSNSSILVKSGSTLSIEGTLSIGDNVSIIVEDGGGIAFNDAICTWGVNSELIVEDSSILVINSVLQSASSGGTWEGMNISNAGFVALENSTVSGAVINEITNSTVQVTNCVFNVPAQGTGLSISNSMANQKVWITSTMDYKGFYGTGINNFGLVYSNPNAEFYISRIVFDGLWIGLANGSNKAIGDTIQYCQFNNNSKGMHLIGGSYSPLISNCTFLDNELGAFFEVASPNVVSCDFISCDVGIRTETSTASSGGIFDSTFDLGDIAIKSRGSNQRVANNKFYTNTAILNHSGSILNMGNSAKNLFYAEDENLQFEDSFSYNARVQLYKGHNDFYHKNPGPLLNTWDFHFDTNWYVSYPFRVPINANYNWFEGNTVKISSPGTPSNYVSCSYKDPSPNIQLEGGERMAQALNAEQAGNYLVANDTYKTILDENQAIEMDILYDALDAYFRTAELSGKTHDDTESYLNTKIVQYETEDPILTKYMKDYMVKNHLKAEDFQAAIDMLELMILNAASPIDSLCAVMDLEIVLQLAEMSEIKKPISTKLTQYKYPNRTVYKAKHEEHWELLDELSDMGQDDLLPIPDEALISSNYPNPFNPSTTITYSMPATGQVRISVYNMKGQKVRDLLNTEMPRGNHKVVWDGKDSNNSNVSSGIYFFKLETEGHSSVRKAMLMK